MTGPLSGMKIVELAGVGPGPFCAMLLSDLGANVLRIERPGIPGKELGAERPRRYSIDFRGRNAITLDVKTPLGLRALLELIDRADALIDVYRPGVTERLGFGPDECLRRNPRLVYGRMTGWGQDGPLAPAAGHDLNYIGLTGVLDAIGRHGEPPSVPLNLIGDYGGGALYLALGIVAAVYDAARSGLGQVVDAAIVDGAASLATIFYALRQSGAWTLERGTNMFDSGAPYYDVYRCRDGRYLAFAPVEQRFYDNALRVLGLDPDGAPSRDDQRNWPALRTSIATAIGKETQGYWTQRFAGTDACVTPVLTLDEAQQDPHLAARGVFASVDGVSCPAPAPRFSRTSSDSPRGVPEIDGVPASTALKDWLEPEEIEELIHSGLFAGGATIPAEPVNGG